MMTDQSEENKVKDIIHSLSPYELERLNIFLSQQSDENPQNVSIARHLFEKEEHDYEIVFDVYEIVDFNGMMLPSYYYTLSSDEAFMNGGMKRISGGTVLLKEENAEQELYMISFYEEDETLPFATSMETLRTVIPEDCSYYIASEGKYLFAGEEMPYPLQGDIYKYKFYEYKFNCSSMDMGEESSVEQWGQWVDAHRGWSAKVLDDTLETYPDLPVSIAGCPVLHLMETYKNCRNLKEAPQIPPAVTIMTETFYGCEKLQKANIIIPKSVRYFDGTFMWCGELTGEITIHATPVEYSKCFWRTIEPIMITGECRNKAELAAEAGRGVAGGGDNIFY